MTDANKNLVELHQHKEFKAKQSKWTGWLTLYEGDHDKLRDSRYLWLHEYEADASGASVKDDGKKIRAIREERSRYVNLCETAISRYVSFFFRGEMKIPPELDEILTDEIKANFDGKGNSLDTFIKESFAIPALVAGRVVMVVDTPNQKANTLADEKSLGLRPYVTAYSPLQVPDWSLSTLPKLYGKPQFLRTEYEREVPRISEEEPPKTERVSVAYRLIKNGDATQYQQLTYTDRSSENKDATNGRTWAKGQPILFDKVTELPVTIYDSESFLKDGAEMQLLTFNFMSAESSCINAQAFQKIFISGEQDEDKAVLLNEFAINLLAADSTVTVVEPGSTDPLEKAILRSIDWFFKVMFNQVDGLSHSSKESPSADTRRQMKDEFIALVETTLGKFEDALASVVRHIALLSGQEPPPDDVRITFDKTVTDADYEQELQIWGAFADQFKKIPAVNAQILKRQVRRLGLDDLDAIDAEIDKAVEKSADEAQQTADAQRTALLAGVVNADKSKPQGVNGDKGTGADPAQN